MPLRNIFVVARNAHGRPTLQHKLIDRRTSMTACGRDISGWSRAYSAEPIQPILCKHDNCGGNRPRGRKV